ncbi:ribosomal protein L7/L12 [Pinibacter soli]|uniref:Ribosomal protein L7/L12 n=1 Tax=Pinibacter soli TaxID=3044211 RepID=A0ABT6RBX4_9BACT|nr:ribosomal protein L7/L12 [Pinibacter soli]MDI3319397.1 ribosomal protein L7/L12 [Pinibacter soli]
MDTQLQYCQSYRKYFWQWEDNATVITIPDSNTIAYKDYVVSVIGYLHPQGLPPFGSLLAAIAATNANGSYSVDAIYSCFLQDLRKDYDDAFSFLKLLWDLPAEYKTGGKRIQVFQAIFHGCHNSLALVKSKEIYRHHVQSPARFEQWQKQEGFSKQIFEKEFRTLNVAAKRFPTIDSILKRVAMLPEITDDILELEPPDSTEVVSVEKDLMEQLLEHSKTFHAAALIKRLWSGLNIPFHNYLPSQQPLGGVSDISNKGDFNSLLISEFANDDIVFLSRLANNEALYINREVPPTNNEHERIILIDVSIKNWGTPKTIAFALMLAIAKHPKTDIPCRAYAVGKKYYPLSYESIHTIISGLEVLDSCLHASEGLELFFKEHTKMKNVEVFFVSSEDAIKAAPIQKTLHELHQHFSYWINADAEGNVDIYKRQASSKRHMQHLLLPLKELWKKTDATVKQDAVEHADMLKSKWPILFCHPGNTRYTLSTDDGEIFLISDNGCLLRLADKNSSYGETGFELIYTGLPAGSIIYEMGVTDNGQYYLLGFREHRKNLFIVHLSTGQVAKILFEEWQPKYRRNFLFHKKAFYYLTQHDHLKIDVDGSITNAGMDAPDSSRLYNERAGALDKLKQKIYFSESILKNIKTIFINNNGNLVVNDQELCISMNNIISFLQYRETMAVGATTFRFPAGRIDATSNDKETFVFPDGSTVQLNRLGMLRLRSSDSNIADIYVPTNLKYQLGVATDKVFAGKEFYFNERRYDLVLKHFTQNHVAIMRATEDFLKLSLGDARRLLEGDGAKTIYRNAGFEKAETFMRILQDAGAEVEMIENPSSVGENELIKISSREFFTKYIEQFTSVIRAHAVKN